MVEGKMVLKILKPPRDKDSLGSLTGQSFSWVFNVSNSVDIFTEPEIFEDLRIWFIYSIEHSPVMGLLNILKDGSE